MKQEYRICKKCDRLFECDSTRDEMYSWERGCEDLPKDFCRCEECGGWCETKDVTSEYVNPSKKGDDINNSI